MKKIMIIIGTTLAIIGGEFTISALNAKGMDTVILAILGFAFVVAGLDLNLYACEKFK